MIKKILSFFIKSILWFTLVLILSFKVFDYTILNEKKTKLEQLYTSLPVEYQTVSDKRKREIIDFMYKEHHSQFGGLDKANWNFKALVYTSNILVFILSPDGEEEAPMMLYNDTISSLMRGKNYTFHGYTSYHWDKVCFDLALIKMDMDKVLCLYEYYSAVDEKGKFIHE